jgi:hypothetical protein
MERQMDALVRLAKEGEQQMLAGWTAIAEDRV